jgi:hypothetical protein
MISTVVHTTGVNWDAILVNASAVLVIVATFSGILNKVLSRSITDKVKDVIKADVTPVLDQIQTSLRDHDTRLARIEGIEEGKRQLTAQSKLTSTP